MVQRFYKTRPEFLTSAKSVWKLKPADREELLVCYSVFREAVGNAL